MWLRKLLALVVMVVYFGALFGSVSPLSVRTGKVKHGLPSASTNVETLVTSNHSTPAWQNILKQLSTSVENSQVNETFAETLNSSIPVVQNVLNPLYKSLDSSEVLGTLFRSLENSDTIIESLFERLDNSNVIEKLSATLNSSGPVLQNVLNPPPKSLVSSDVVETLFGSLDNPDAIIESLFKSLNNSDVIERLSATLNSSRPAMQNVPKLLPTNQESSGAIESRPAPWNRSGLDLHYIAKRTVGSSETNDSLSATSSRPGTGQSTNLPEQPNSSSDMRTSESLSSVQNISASDEFTAPALYRRTGQSTNLPEQPNSSSDKRASESLPSVQNISASDEFTAPALYRRTGQSTNLPEQPNSSSDKRTSESLPSVQNISSSNKSSIPAPSQSPALGLNNMSSYRMSPVLSNYARGQENITDDEHTQQLIVNADMQMPELSIRMNKTTGQLIGISTPPVLKNITRSQTAADEAATVWADDPMDDEMVWLDLDPTFKFMNWSVDDIEAIPRDILVKNMWVAEQINLSDMAMTRIWNVLKGTVQVETVSVEMLKELRTLIYFIPESDLFRLNMTDWEVINYLGSLAGFTRRKLGVLSYALQKAWGEKVFTSARAINAFGNLLCGFPPMKLATLSAKTLMELKESMFDKCYSCTPRQMRKLLDIAQTPDAYGPVEIWGRKQVRRLGLLVTQLTIDELVQLRPSSMKGIEADVLNQFTNTQLSSLAQSQVAMMTEAAISTYRLRLGVNSSPAATFSLHPIVTIVLVTTLVVWVRWTR